MCMSLRIEPKEMAEVLIKIRKMPFAQEMSIKLGKSLRHGDLHIRLHLNLLSTAAWRLPIQRYCGKIHGIGEGVLSLHHGIMNGDILYMRTIAAA